jgi:hypothetical protein
MLQRSLVTRAVGRVMVVLLAIVGAIGIAGALGSSMMAVAGLAQVALEHPQLADRYDEPLARAVHRLLEPRASWFTRDAGTTNRSRTSMAAPTTPHTSAT